MRGAACSAPSCWTPATDAPGEVPLCGSHLASVREALGLPPVGGGRAKPPACTSVVYYLTLDGGRTVKIGTTTTPRARFNALGKRATGVMRVLVAEPGSYREERQLHRRFRHLAAGVNEYFHLTEELSAHVEKVRRDWPEWEAILTALDERHASARKLASDGNK